ncbi:lysoplasmalogenase [Marivirga sp. S37H4]|uniref:Lysoplasmalogenase n=1 Tax=Marivirga aurantiaca TaxID=2802615 RepID=A0A934WVH2_9BACT|nr:lysoplasmalogenase [Marivirga aurantiaca]MBK6263789.1 lysoplasmalogenase [Marivirga aurantiaca]
MISKKYFFFLAAVGEIISLLFQIELLHQICKPLLVLTLLMFFWEKSDHRKNEKWVIHVTLALAFSWIGDVMLLFTDKNFLFFFAGLGSFLVAHLFYILAYWKATYERRLKFHLSVVPFVVIGYAVLMGYLILPYLDGIIQIPVGFYAVIISLMVVFAWYRRGQTSSSSFQWVFIGAILFVVSDSILAINRFAETIPYAGLAVMITYIAAQWTIVNGLLKHPNES